jgi:glycosyltransferase involved in cell wall biosynthesis
MRLLFVTPHTKLSGGVKVIFNMAQRLQIKGHTVIVAANKINDSMLWYPHKKNFKLMQRSELNRHTLPDVDCIINFGDGTAFAPIPAKLPQILFLQGFGTQSYEREVVNLLYPYTAVIATSRWLAELAQKSGHNRVFIIPPGIDPYFRSMPTVKGVRRLTIGCLYHDAPAKNVKLFAAAMNKLVTKMPDVQALFISVKHPTNTKFFEEDIRCPVSLFVNPPQHILPVIYSSCNAWVSPSVNEGFGLTTLEAMACEVPAIVVPNLGLDEYLKDSHNCLLVKDRSKDSMVAAIITALTKESLRKILITNGRRLATRFTWDRSADAFADVLGTLEELQ